MTENETSLIRAGRSKWQVGAEIDECCVMRHCLLLITAAPDLRDNAQDARSFLLETLLNSRLPETLTAIHELAQQPELGHMPDRLRQMAYEIAAQITSEKKVSSARVAVLVRDALTSARHL